MSVIHNMSFCARFEETQQFEEFNILMYSFCGCQHFVDNSEINTFGSSQP